MRRILVSISATALMMATTAVPALAQNNAQQSGLVNLATGDVTVQVPVAVAANVCNVAVNVVAQNTQPGQTTTCDALANAQARNGR